MVQNTVLDTADVVVISSTDMSIDDLLRDLRMDYEPWPAFEPLIGEWGDWGNVELECEEELLEFEEDYFYEDDPTRDMNYDDYEVIASEDITWIYEWINPSVMDEDLT